MYGVGIQSALNLLNFLRKGGKGGVLKQFLGLDSFRLAMFMGSYGGIFKVRKAVKL